MLLIIASARIRPDELTKALEMSLEHVRRSRGETGCVSHEVSQDAEDPNRLVFVERWADQAALDAHFVQPDALAFSRALGGMCTERAGIDIYRAERIGL